MFHQPYPVNTVVPWLVCAQLTTSLRATQSSVLMENRAAAVTVWQLVTAVKVERWGWEKPNEVLLLMRLGLISLSLSCSSVIGMHLVLLPLSSTAAPKDSASNIAIQLKHSSNTTGVPAVNFSLFPSEWIRIHEYQNARLKTYGETLASLLESDRINVAGCPSIISALLCFTTYLNGFTRSLFNA